MILFSELRPKEIVFNHVADDGTQTDIAVERLEQFCKDQKLEVFEVEIDADFAQFCLEARGIEQHRLTRLTAEHLDIPTIYGAWPDGSHMLFDGNHRYVRRVQLGLKTIYSYIVPENVWRNFTISGFPRTNKEILKNLFSGIV